MIEQKVRWESLTQDFGRVIETWKVLSDHPMESSMMAVLGEAKDVPNDPGSALKDLFDGKSFLFDEPYKLWFSFQL